jgi:hypothetical protein
MFLAANNPCRRKVLILITQNPDYSSCRLDCLARQCVFSFLVVPVECLPFPSLCSRAKILRAGPDPAWHLPFDKPVLHKLVEKLAIHPTVIRTAQRQSPYFAAQYHVGCHPLGPMISMPLCPSFPLTYYNKSVSCWLTPSLWLAYLQPTHHGHRRSNHKIWLCLQRIFLDTISLLDSSTGVIWGKCRS